ncbi:hypothetical protein A2526_06525 [candidate division WOR-1 bacterium RIFOXYD2_FULL_36_8]|uniref:Uncharacterized protein n=1 Tax=candidate division WOR-1 bacterium RIFOXYB2_FULL_36_35 TaxID=1802578 RepID=A0A1F4S2J4_UNCSA|nr:MAG: hypothetical protein A2230_04485 [candidate division WOR-1 bacterium RIFOXYA2_FULL_36_21]OGC14651.1 MAG: hypothetical protein A2290_01215 [candidate division WOR-1 bacterium RIFOXYB2_FULL_36_35]OGC19669.1 MAG: hypothetical protein A2282_02940 [candidate division WOR-1 bacterium RIFOXYA12_FULL_36_13]OGC38007.1 MAG: hypothetical protein A2526_06525 [candidate division WOR-1 bacterium RIFOXYD2_FULL_36_8]
MAVTTNQNNPSEAKDICTLRRKGKTETFAQAIFGVKAFNKSTADAPGKFVDILSKKFEASPIETGKQINRAV